jgi:hypothetical protein
MIVPLGVEHRIEGKTVETAPMPQNNRAAKRKAAHEARKLNRDKEKRLHRIGEGNATK